MHELSVCQQIIKIARKHCNHKQVKSIYLKIGQYSCIDKATLEFAFVVASKATILENAKLIIEETQGNELFIEHMEVC